MGAKTLTVVFLFFQSKGDYVDIREEVGNNDSVVTKGIFVSLSSDLISLVHHGRRESSVAFHLLLNSTPELNSYVGVNSLKVSFSVRFNRKAKNGSQAKL